MNLSITNEGDGTVRINFSGAETADEYHIYRWFPTGETVLLGSFSSNPLFVTGLDQEEIYYLRVSAENDLGESPATEVLGVIPYTGKVPVLIVNGFDRISGTNNTRDFIKRHAPSIQASDFTFDSCTNEAVETGMINLKDYRIVDWILGEEGTATGSFSRAEQVQVEVFLAAGGALFVSGSEIGYDLVAKGDSDDARFYADYLKADYISDAAGGQQGTYHAFGSENGIFSEVTTLTFDDGSHGTYDVDWPDGIKTAQGSQINLKYTGVDYDSRGGAGIQYTGSFGNSGTHGALVHLAIPFESIYPAETRNAVMKNILDYFAPVASVSNKAAPLAQEFSLKNIYPNPFNTRVTFEIQMPADIRRNSPLQLQIVDILGRLAATLPLTGVSINGEAVVTWDGLLTSGQAAPAGVYTAVLKGGSVISEGSLGDVKKFTLLK